MLPKDPNVDVKNQDVEKEKKDDEKIKTKSARTIENIKSIYKDNYFDKARNDDGTMNEDKLLALLADREKTSNRRFGTVVSQKIGWRDKALKGNKVEDGSGDPSLKEKKEDEVKSSFDKIRNIERDKAVQNFLGEIVKENPEEFKSQEDLTMAYEKIKAEYKEDGTEVRREDFKSQLQKAFKLSHPDLYEERIKADERKRLSEKDIDVSNIIEKDQRKDGESKERNFIKRKPSKEKVSDWLLGKDK